MHPGQIHSHQQKKEDVIKYRNIIRNSTDRYIHVSSVKLKHYFLVKSFTDLVKYLFTLEDVKKCKLSFLSNKLCQDPLECFFGCQRQRGGTSDNPSAADFYNNTQALRVVDSFCRGPVKGNCRGYVTDVHKIKADDYTPLTRRKRPRHK